MLQQVQGDDVVDYDIDEYAARLDQILERKAQRTEQLRRQLASFRRMLQHEEAASRRVQAMPSY